MTEKSDTHSRIPPEQARKAEAAYDEGQLHHSNRRYQKALEAFKLAHETDPENDRYLFKLAAAYHNTGEYQRSADKYFELIELLRQRPFKEQLLLALAYRGGNLALLGNLAEAEALIEEALEMDSVSPIGLAMKGLFFLCQDDPKRALEFLDLALEIDPTNKIVTKIREQALERQS